MSRDSPEVGESGEDGVQVSVFSSVSLVVYLDRKFFFLKVFVVLPSVNVMFVL